MLLHILLVLATSVWAIHAFMNPEIQRIPLGLSTWSGEIVFSIDKMSAFFILIVNFICLMGIIYAVVYLKPYL